MKLRIRLIVAFLLLSVLPLGAVTVYSYITNRAALEAAATREADDLALELSGRMTLVTAQLGQSIERLMDIPSPSATVARQAEVKASAAATAEPAVAATTLDTQVADTLGSAAMLLNTVEMPRPRGPDGFGRGPRLGPRGGPGGGRPDDLAPIARGDGPPSEFPGLRPAPDRRFRRGDIQDPGNPPSGPPPDDGSRRGGPSAPQGPDSPPVPDSPPGADSVDRVQIDLGNIRREMFRQIVPEGTNPSEMTPEQRQRVAADINQRLLGIGEGIKLAAAELQRKAEEARRKAEAEAKAQAALAAPVRQKAALMGNRLNVTREQNGKVIRTANAEINLPNVLMTVFSSTPRGQGEVPFAVGKDGRLYTTTDENRATVEQLAPAYRPNGASTVGEWIVVMTAGPAGSDLRLGIARPVADSLSELRRTAGRNAGLGLLFIGLAIVAIVPLSGRLTHNLSTLTGGVRRIASGDYAARVSVKSRDEIGELAQAFNQMAAQVETHERAIVGQERIKRELELGRQIQHDMLPREPLRLGLTEITGVSVPAREVGGDFFNYSALPNGQIALVVGDVSGKGVGAALLMANIQASLRTRLGMGQDLSAIADAIDRDLEANSPGQMYATLFLGVLDPATRTLRYVNAGHLPQFVLREQGEIERLSATGLPVGLLAGRGYAERDVQLAEGNLIFFYTDGCVETESEAEDMFGAERLETLLASLGAAGTDAVLQRVERALKAFRGTREPFDDATMMAVRIG